MNKKGFALVLSLLTVLALSILLAGFFLKSINEKGLAERHAYNIKAFWLAEAGIAESVNNLPNNVSNCLQDGHCYATVVLELSGEYYQINSVGTVSLPSGGQVEKELEVVVKVNRPDASNFPDAIQTTGELITKGRAYTINGTINEQAALNFADLFECSKEEMELWATHYYSDQLLEPIDGITWVDTTDGNELTVAGNLQGSGILVIFGDVHFSGTLDINGIVYVIGKLRMSGTPTINGTILAESQADIDTTIVGHVTINHNTEIISNALIFLQGVSSEIVSWKEEE